MLKKSMRFAKKKKNLLQTLLKAYLLGLEKLQLLSLKWLKLKI